MTAIESEYTVRIFGSNAGPYIRLPGARLPELKCLLDEHHIDYFVEEDMSSLNGGPYLAYVNLPPTQSVETIGALVEHMNLNG